MNNQEAEEEALGNWPRRLLHVPTLTSYSWQPGNTYGGIAEPRYNAISYTWGRWRLKDSEKPDVKAVPIEGVDWPLPRIDPAHFSVEEFELAIKNAASIDPVTHPEDVKVKKTDFLWLDVACIDQRPSEAQSAAEIGRQAVIFRGAFLVFVWFTTLSLENARKWLHSISEFEDSANADLDHHRTLIDDTTKFLSDPWFSSLWTVQEAFLCRHAFLLTREAALIDSKLIRHSRGYTRLVDTWNWGEQLDSICSSKSAGSPEAAIYTKVSKSIVQTGLRALLSEMPAAVYQAARFRTTTFPEDRFYGIQQAFGFRLGKSSLTAKPADQFSVSDLEDQFGAELISKQPLFSQFHVFTRHVPREDRWRFNRCSVAPIRGDTSISTWTFPEENPWCSFWIDHSTSNTKPVHWQGNSTPLAQVLETCKWVNEEIPRSDAMYFEPELQIIPDVADELEGSPVHQKSEYKSNPADESQFKFGEWLVSRFGRCLQVLLLGPPPGMDMVYWRRGLLLLDCGDGSWTRLGVCQWYACEDTYGLGKFYAISSQADFLIGKGPKWKKQQGVFGFVCMSTKLLPTVASAAQDSGTIVPMMTSAFTARLSSR